MRTSTIPAVHDAVPASAARRSAGARLRSALQCLLLVLLADSAYAQKTPGGEHGFRPDRLYQTTDVDSVNLLNGNLTVTIPIGLRYPLTPAFSYQLNLVYNGKIWDYQQFDLNGDDRGPLAYAKPSIRSNAGAGWRLTLGRLLNKTRDDPTIQYPRADVDEKMFIYESPYGDEHTFHTTTLRTPIDEDVAEASVLVTHDSRLRLRKVGESALGRLKVIIDFPSGEQHTFERWSDKQWRLMEQADAFGNWVRITYEPTNPDLRWTITDSAGRTHTLTFEYNGLMKHSVSHGYVVSRAEMEAFTPAGEPRKKAVYVFNKANQSVLWPCNHDPGALPLQGDLDTSTNTSIPLLTSVSLNDGSTYTFDYHRPGVPAQAGEVPSTACEQGALKTLTLPSGAATSYTYQPYLITHDRCNLISWIDNPLGVATRKTADGTWDYVQTSGPPINLYTTPSVDWGCGPRDDGSSKPPTWPSRWTRTSVLSPAIEREPGNKESARRTRTDHYFALWPDGSSDDGWSESDPMDPEPVRAPGSPRLEEFYRYKPGIVIGPFAEESQNGLSTDGPETYLAVGKTNVAADATNWASRGRLTSRTFVNCANDRSGNCSAAVGGQLIRTEYRRLYPVEPFVHILGEGMTEWTKTVFHDDLGCSSKPCEMVVSSGEFDNVGRPARSETTSTFPDSQSVVTTTQYPQWSLAEINCTGAPQDQEDSGTATGPDDPDNPDDPGTPACVLKPWSFDDYTKRTVVKQDSAPVTEERCYDTSGFLTRTRRWRGVAAGANDLLHVQSRVGPDGGSADGHVAGEAFYGGDDTPLAADFATCTGTLTESPRYEIHHATANGVRRESQFDGLPFKSLDHTIDLTGLVTSSFDPARRKTTFNYDLEGRPLSVQPPDSPWTKLTYLLSNRPPAVKIQQFAHGAAADTASLSERFAYYDNLGRVIQEKVRMPGGWSTTAVKYDALGRTIASTLPVLTTVSGYSSSLSAKATLFEYDSFGRKTKITEEADGSKVSFTYSGTRETKRTVSVATVAVPGGAAVTTTEHYDALGQLVRVEEPAGVGGANSATSYTYDTAGNLTTVDADGQRRTFLYDGAGLLIGEDHPESPATRYRYDARGNLISKVHQTCPLDVQPCAGKTLEIAYKYDDAGRLETVTDQLSGKLLSKRTYDLHENVNAPGAMLAQTRNNYVSSGTYGVTDLFTYDDAGRIASKTTQVRKGTDVPVAFAQSFAYASNGAPKTVEYPNCQVMTSPAENCAGIPAARRTIDLAYRDGLLTAVGAATAAQENGNDPITYTAAGRVEKVQHATATGGRGVLDEFTPDPNGLSRVSEISFRNAPQCALVAADPGDVTAAAGTEVILEPVTADAATAIQWYEGVSGDVTVPVASADKKLTLTTSTETKRYWYRAFVANGSCEYRSRTITISACTPATVALPAYPSAIAAGTSLPMSVQAGGTGVSLVWSYKAANGQGATFSTSSTAVFTPPAPGLYTVTVTATTPAPCAVVVHASAIIDVVVTLCVPRFGNPLNPKSPVMSINAGRRLSVSMIEVEGAAYSFRWFENGSAAKTQDGPEPISTYDMFVRGEDKLIRLEAWLTCTVGAGSVVSQKIVGETYGTVVDRCPPAPPLTVEPRDVINEDTNSTVTFTASSTQPDATYQWYRGDSGNTSWPIVDARAKQLTVATVPSTYWVRATSSCGLTTDSPTVSYAHASCSPVRLSKQPADTTSVAGADVTLSVDAAGTPSPSQYRWHQTPASQVNGGTGRSVTVRPRKTTDYWVYVSNGCSREEWVAASRKARVRITSCADITVSSQPQDVTSAAGTPIHLSIQAQAVEPLLYQWYRGESGDDSQIVDGATTATLALSPGVSGTYWVRVSFADPRKCAIDSRTVSVTTCGAPKIGGPADPDAVVDVISRSGPNQEHALFVDATGERLAIAWYRGAIGDESNKLQSTTRYQVVSPANTTSYWVKVTSACPLGDIVRRRAYRVSVCPVDITPPMASKTVVVPGSKVTLTIARPSGDQVEWFAYTASAPSNKISLGSGTTKESPAITEKTFFFVRITNGACSVDSDAVDVRLCDPIRADWGTGNPTKVAQDSTHTLTIHTDPPEPVTDDNPAPNLSVQFYEGTVSGDLAGSTLIGSGALTLRTNFPQTRSFWVRILLPATGCYTDSSVRTIEVCVPEIKTHPQSTTLDKTSNPTAFSPLTVVATPASGLTYQWYTGESGHAANPVPGATQATYNASPAADTSYWVRVTGCGVSRDSEAALVRICKPPTISQQPFSGTLQPGVPSIPLSVNADGTELTYQWYRGAVGVTSSPFSTERVVNVSPNVTTDYWVRVTGRCGAVSSELSKVSVAPAIAVQPIGGPVTKGSGRTLQVEATGTQLAFQWYRVSGTTATLLTGATNASYATGPLTADSSYYCEVKSGTAWTKTATVTLTVCLPRTISVSGDNGVSGAEVTLSVNAPAAGETYEWYAGAGGSTATPLGTGTSKKVSPSTTTSYWMRTKRTDCDADSAAVTVRICLPVITVQPQGTTVNPNGQHTLRVTAAGPAPLTYQWFSGVAGDTSSPVSGQTADVFTTPALNANASYWVRVTAPAASGCGVTSVNSTAATVTVCKPPVITQEPGDVTWLEGAAAPILDVNASGDGLTFQWYNGVKGVVASPLAATETVKVAPSDTTDYWVRISGNCGQVDSRTVRVSVAPRMTLQPASAAITKGTGKALTVDAAGTFLTFQWYSVSGSSSTLLAGATGKTYTTGALNADAAYYCQVRSGNASVNSATATLTICQPRTISVSGDNGVSGAEVTLSVVSPAAGETYEWYAGASGNIATPLGTGTSKKVTPAATASYWMRTKRSGCDADSTAVTVKVCLPAISVQPQGTTVNPNGQHTLYVTAAGPSVLTYQWYSGAAGDTSNPVSGQTSSTMTTPPLATARTYWVRVSATSAGCAVTSVNSTAATVNVCTPPAITQQPFDRVWLAGSAAPTLDVNSTGDGRTFQWYTGVAGVTTSPLSTAETITVAPNETTDYWVRVSGTCGHIDSRTAKISVDPVIMTQPAGEAITKGTSRTLTIGVRGSQLSYQWFQVSGTTATLLPGATGSSYTTGPLTVDTSYYCQVKSGHASVNSATATLTICQPRAIHVSGNSGVSASEVTLSVDAPATGETYEWYAGAVGVTTTPLGIGTTKKVWPTSTTSYWVRTKRAGCDADSAAVTVRVCLPAISAQPQGTGVEPNGQHTLSVTATGPAPLTYQWYIGASGVTTNPISGQTGSSFTTPAMTATTTYWVRVSAPAATGCAGTVVNSTVATVTVCARPAISTQPRASTIISKGSTAYLSVAATGEGLSYQWYEGPRGTTTTRVGTNSATLQRTPTTTRYYWVRVQGTCGTVDSEAALVSVDPTIDVQPADTAICKPGDVANFSVTASGSPLSYEWYRKDGTVWTLVGSTANAAVTIPTLPGYVRVIVRSGDAAETSVTAIVTENAKPNITSISSSLVSTGRYRLTVVTDVADGSTIRYEWYEGPLGNTTAPIGTAQQIYVTPAPPTTYWVRVYYTDTGCYSDKAKSF